MSETIIAIVLGTLLGLVLGAVLALLWSRRYSEQRLQQLREQLAETQQALAGCRAQVQYLEPLPEQLAARERTLSELRAAHAELGSRREQEQKHFQEQLALLQSARAELSREFENIANRIFESKQQQFSTSSKNLLQTTLDPLKTQLAEFRKKVEDVYEKENSARSQLAGQVEVLQKQAQKISQEAVNLAQALKGSSKAQGNWGEIILERLLEQSGLQKGREYETQVSFRDAGGSRRMPDVIVRLPDNKDIIIDSKVSLVDYERYCSAESEDERQQYLAQHVNSLRNHIKGLSIKDYENLEGVRALDFVFIFIPVEAAFMLALQQEPGLYKEAYDRHIILASPTTLLAILRTVENIWRHEKQNRNAERIAKEAGGLHDQFVLLVEALDQVGAALERTHTAYDIARKRLSTGRGNLLKRVSDIRKLGAKTKKRLPDSLEVLSDESEAPELEDDQEEGIES